MNAFYASYRDDWDDGSAYAWREEEEAYAEYMRAGMAARRRKRLDDDSDAANDRGGGGGIRRRRRRRARRANATRPRSASSTRSAARTRSGASGPRVGRLNVRRRASHQASSRISRRTGGDGGSRRRRRIAASRSPTPTSRGRSIRSRVGANPTSASFATCCWVPPVRAPSRKVRVRTPPGERFDRRCFGGTRISFSPQGGLAGGVGGRGEDAARCERGGRRHRVAVQAVRGIVRRGSGGRRRRGNCSQNCGQNCYSHAGAERGRLRRFHAQHGPHG